MTAKTQQIAAGAQNSRDWDLMWERYGISVVLVVAWLLAAWFAPNFTKPDNLLNVIRQASFIGVAAVGMTVAIIFGTFDLSVGAMLALCAWVTVSLACQVGVPLAVLAGLGTGLLVGLINGVLVSYVRIPAFIATLGMMYIVGGFNYVLTQGGALARCNKPDFIWMGNGSVYSIPVPFIVFVVCAFLGAALLNLTAFGRYVYAGGTNARAAQVAGVPMRRVTMLVFVVVGLFTAVSAVLLGARLYSAGPGLEPGFELRVIATVVLGGTPLSGGRGSLLGTVAASVLFATLANVLNLVHADSFLQYVVIGLVLLVAVSIEGVRQRIAERLSRK